MQAVQCDVQEIAPFLRVLGCYPMDLNAGDVSVAPADLPVDDHTLSGTGLGMRSDDLLMAVSGASARMPMQAILLLLYSPEKPPELCGTCSLGSVRR